MFALMYVGERYSNGIFAILPVDSEIEARFILEGWINDYHRSVPKNFVTTGYMTVDGENPLTVTKNTLTIEDFDVIPLSEYTYFYTLREISD